MSAPLFQSFLRQLRRVLFLGLLAVTLLVCLYLTVAYHFAYSRGDSVGFVQKLSYKGWICKTWEGELLLTSMPGAIPEKFEFSVRDDSIVDELQRNAGRKVVLGYEQHKGLPTSCFGDTEYFVNRVSVFAE